MAHSGKITEELRKKLYQEIQDSIFDKVMQAVRLAGDGSRKSENALKNITRCVVELAIEEAEKKHRVKLIPEPDVDIVGVEWDECGKPHIKEDK